jgi:hypothetical protein
MTPRVEAVALIAEIRVVERKASTVCGAFCCRLEADDNEPRKAGKPADMTRESNNAKKARSLLLHIFHFTLEEAEKPLAPGCVTRFKIDLSTVFIAHFALQKEG